MGMTIKYRAPDLTKLEVSSQDIWLPDFNREVCLRFLIEEVDGNIFHSHWFILKNYEGLKNEDVIQINESISIEVFNSIFDIILNDEWKVDKGVSKDGCKKHDFREDDRYAKNLQITKEGVKYALSPHSLITQSRIAQRVIIEMLFIANRPVPTGYLLYESYIPENVFHEELRILSELGLTYTEASEREIDYNRFTIRNELTKAEEIYNTMGKDWHIRLAAKGRERFERLYTGFGKSVFIIIWCELKWLIAFLKEAVKDEGYEAYVQEYEEPPKDIGSDIKERIANCAFVIADLTGGRENCLYELGYAHALNKRTIITRKEDEVKKTTDEGEEVWKLTFDINQNKHSLWVNENDEEFKEAIKERISQTIKSIEQDYFTI